MNSIACDFREISVQSLLRPVADATAALARLDERIAGSPVGDGWIERMHFADACASLRVDGRLVHVEDLVLHDAGSDIHTPTHELAIAHDVLRTRRRIAAHPPAWALGSEGLGRLCGRTADAGMGEGAGLVMPDVPDAGPLGDELAAVDAALARAAAVLAGGARPQGRPGRDPLVSERDEGGRLAQWRGVLSDTEGLPPVLRAVLLLDAWNAIEVLRQAPWLGRLLAAASLREAGLTTAAHLAAVSFGVQRIAWERRMSRDRETRLLALLAGLAGAVEAGRQEHDRLLLARRTMERRLVGRRRSSKLPELIAFVLARPMVSTGTAARAMGVTPRAALRAIETLNLREFTGRGRFRAWGIL